VPGRRDHPFHFQDSFPINIERTPNKTEEHPNHSQALQFSKCLLNRKDKDKVLPHKHPAAKKQARYGGGVLSQNPMACQRKDCSTWETSCVFEKEVDFETALGIKLKLGDERERVNICQV
jgi:hypothetical protein